MVPSHLRLSLLAALLLAACGGATTSSVDGAGPLPAQPNRIFYVSPTGGGTDGKSWDTAWKELANINWDVIEPGDLILIDGGKPKPEGETGPSITYNTTLTVKKSGRDGMPIQIRMATEEGRNGNAMLFGGRAYALPYCGETGFQETKTPIREVGIDLSDRQWIHIDASRWSGLRVTAHDGPGIRFNAKSSHITVRHVEVDDNGVPDYKPDGTWYPSGTGIHAGGDHLLFERMIVHDNGGDAVLTTEGISHLVIRQSWLFNRRQHPEAAKEPFNVCARGNGVHIAEGGEQYFFDLEDSIIGPGFANGLLLGDARDDNVWAIMNDVTVKNTLLVSHHGPSSVSNVSGVMPARHAPKRWRFQQVTSIRDANAPFTNIAALGKGHIVEDSIIVGAEQVMLDSPNVARNCQWGTTTGAIIGEASEPTFVDDVFDGVGVNFSSFNFALAEGSWCAGMGSTITSTTALYATPDSAVAPVVDAGGVPDVDPETGNGNALPTVSFQLPADNAEFAPGSAIQIIVNATDSDGSVAKVEFFANGSSLGTVLTAPYTTSWSSAPAGEHTLVVKATDNLGAVSEISRRVSIKAGAPAPPSPPPTPAPVLSFEAENATLTGFASANGCISQANAVQNPADGGEARITFNITTPGNYLIYGTVTAANTTSNSFFIDVDNQPAATSIWDLTVTAAPQEQQVRWRGNGTEAAPEFNPRVFTLSAGQHTLIIRGREANACLDKIRLAMQ